MTIFDRAKNVIKSLWSKIVGRNDDEIERQRVNIDISKLIFKGKSDWLNQVFIGVDGYKHKRVMASINPYKIICQEFAGLIFSEKPIINTDNVILLDLLDKNNFYNKQVTQTEWQIALGSQALKWYVENDKIKIDYITADCIIPISWDNKGINECAFLDYRNINNKKYVRVESHKKHYMQIPVIDPETITQAVSPDGIPLFENGDQDGYEIRNEIYLITDAGIKKDSLSSLIPEMAEVQFLPIIDPLFVIINNPIANNMSAENPMGLPLNANCNDTFKMIDTAFDNLGMNLELCVPRINVADELVRKVPDENGNFVKYFDPTDRIYQAVPFSDSEKSPIQDMTIPLVVEPWEQAIQGLFDILCVQIGLSPGTLTFKGNEGIVTATQIISQNSKTYKTRQKYIDALTEGYQKFFLSGQELLSYLGQSTRSISDISIYWDDSIIQDRDADSAYWINLYEKGQCARWFSIKNIFNLTEKEAKIMATEVEAEERANRVTDVNFIGE